MSVSASEISSIIKDKIAKSEANIDVAQVGKVLSVGDGVARVYGLDEVQAGELVEFSSGVKGMALNLEEDNVGVVILGEYTRNGTNMYDYTFEKEKKMDLTLKNGK